MNSVNVTGNVGIGTTNPANQLDVSGTISSRNLLLQGDGTDAYIRPTNASSSLYLGSNNNNHMKISSAGNVGIGTNSPGCTLDVNGPTRINGQLDISNFIDLNAAAKQVVDSDGYGSVINYYDGTEDSVEYDGKTYYIFGIEE
jgi:hypothetical protein